MSAVGPEVMTPEPVKIALCSLAAVGTTVQYPPINWNVFLSPLMRLNFGKVAFLIRQLVS